MTVKIVMTDGRTHILNAATITLGERGDLPLVVHDVIDQVFEFKFENLKRVHLFYPDGYEEILYTNDNY